MTTRKDQPGPPDDVEKPHPLAVESGGDGTSAPVKVRLNDPWSDLLRVADKRSSSDSPRRSSSALALLDDMKGILQWD
ncbi:MAG: hypothetical protein QOD47_752 [Gemmatimonadaceae bacterium]|jgi:hypothetical protein|nr:hypothetical protein [Gemmatimonadaceae bacterium]